MSNLIWKCCLLAVFILSGTGLRYISIHVLELEKSLKLNANDLEIYRSLQTTRHG